MKFESWFRKLDSPLNGLLILTFLGTRDCRDLVPLRMESFFDGEFWRRMNGKEFKRIFERRDPFKGREGDLGVGYDGQVFYFDSKSISSLSFQRPIGFDTTYRAPRVGYRF